MVIGSIRRAQPSDADIIHRFITELAIYEREPDAVETTPDILASQLSMDRPPFECILVCDPQGTPVGFALFFETYSTWKGKAGIHLEDLYVCENERGQGYGLALLEHLKQLTQERGYPRLEWAVLDWNEPAIRFYQDFGAKPLDEWTTWRFETDS